MKKSKRALVATVIGVICGIISLGIFKGIFAELSLSSMFRMVFVPTMIGFVIGISRISSLNWIAHGLFWGFMFGLLSFSRVLDMSYRFFSDRMDLALFVLSLSIFTGVFIELVTCGIVKLNIKEE